MVVALRGASAHRARCRARDSPNGFVWPKRLQESPLSEHPRGACKLARPAPAGRRCGVRASRVNPTCVDPAQKARSALRVPAATRRVAPGSRVSLRSPGTRACAIPAREATVGRSLFSRFQTAQSSSFPRRVDACGFVLPLAPLRFRFGGRAPMTLTLATSAFPCHPHRGVDGAPTAHLLTFVALARRDLRALRRGQSRCERDLSRRSTVAIFGRGPVLILRPWNRSRPATCPLPGHRPGGRDPEPPAVRFAPPPRDATPCSVSRIVSGRRPS